MYDRAKKVTGLFLRSFYELEFLGGAIPAEGPLVLVTNHSNGLVDPLLLGEVTARHLRFLAKFKVFRMPVLGWLARGVHAIPVYRQKDGVGTAKNLEAFAAVFERLAKGEAVSVFPEGTSHSDAELRPLKTGSARLALGAEEAHGFALGLRVVAVGLVYEDRNRFRSRAHVWVGEPFGIEHLREAYATDQRGAVQTLTDEMDRALRRVTINLERREDRGPLELAERIWPPDGREWPRRLRQLAEGLRWLRRHRPERERRLATRVEALHGRLERHRLDVADLDRPPGAGFALRFAARSALALLAVLPLMTLAVLVWGLPCLAARRVARLKKVPADKYVSALLLACGLLGPLWLVAFAAAAARHGVLAALAVASAAVVLAVAGVRLYSFAGLVLRDLSAFAHLVPQRHLCAELARERDALAREMRALERLGRRQRRGAAA